MPKAAFFYDLRPKKTQGEKTQEFKNSRKKTQTQAQQKKFRHNLTNKLHIYACSVQNFAEFVINFEEFPKNSMKFSKPSKDFPNPQAKKLNFRHFQNISLSGMWPKKG